MEKKLIGYQEFKEIVVEKIKDYLPEQYQDYTAEINEVNKVNCKREALYLRSLNQDLAVAPTLYLDDFYAHYIQNSDMSLTLKIMADYFVNGMEEAAKHSFDMNDVDKLKNNVVMTLVNREANTHLLETCPHRSFLDLEIIYRIVVNGDENGFYSAMVNNHMLTQMGLDEDELYMLAKANTPKLLPASLMEICPEFVICSNNQKAMGAATILYEGLLEAHAERLDSDLFVIPSSRHECLLLPVDDGHDPEGLRRIIADCNDDVVYSEDVLSYNVYRYYRDEKTLRIA